MFRKATTSFNVRIQRCLLPDLTKGIYNRQLSSLAGFSHGDVWESNKIAVINHRKEREPFTYQQVDHRVKQIQSLLKDKPCKRIAFLCAPGEDYVAIFVALWRLNVTLVPLCISHPLGEMEYVLNDISVGLDTSKDVLLLADSTYQVHAKQLSEMTNVPSLVLPDEHESSHAGVDVQQGEPKLIIYTSGTTGKPKGVVIREEAIEASMNDMRQEWKWTAEDRMLHFLPLHHVHGIVNKCLTALSVGATLEFIAFNPINVWNELAQNNKLTLFMGVPSVYFQLIQAFEDESIAIELSKEVAAENASKLRLFVCGSAALPTTHHNKWKQITSHQILERYGMTEFGMGLTNPLEPEESRHPGYVGQPFPSIQVKLVDEETGTLVESGVSGILCVKGKVVFQEYLNKPEATAKEFDKGGWFITGDVARFDEEKQAYQILGRNSVDIIKHNAYKISALEIERKMLEYEQGLVEVSVFGIPDEKYGEVIVALIRPTKQYNQDTLDALLKDSLAFYKIPSQFIMVDSIPKNQMGKVNKKELKRLFLEGQL